MKLTLSWLREHLDTGADIKVIESKLTNIGLEVESIEDRTEELKSFTVAKVINASKHPNADRLKVCEVETIKGNFQVVCGAPNAKTGMLGVFAFENTYIPGTKIKLKKQKLEELNHAGCLFPKKKWAYQMNMKALLKLTKNIKLEIHFLQSMD